LFVCCAYALLPLMCPRIPYTTLFRSCECEVVAVASTDRPGDDLVEQVHGVDRLPELLPRADVVALSLPLTERTRHLLDAQTLALDRKSTRLNSSHVSISYAVFCLKTK